MASLNEVWVKYETLKQIMHNLEIKENNGEEIKGLAFTIDVSDNVNKFEQNVSMYVAQTKEQREAKKERFYVGNGKTFWSNGNQKTFKEMGNQVPVENSQPKSGDNLPF